MNPAAAVRGPKHVVTKGVTPVLSPPEARKLLETIDTGALAGLRNRALLSVLLYSFARVSAVLGMRCQDYFGQGSRGLPREASGCDGGHVLAPAGRSCRRAPYQRTSASAPVTGRAGTGVQVRDDRELHRGPPVDESRGPCSPGELVTRQSLRRAQHAWRPWSPPESGCGRALLQNLGPAAATPSQSGRPPAGEAESIPRFDVRPSCWP